MIPPSPTQKLCTIICKKLVGVDSAHVEILGVFVYSTSVQLLVVTRNLLAVATLKSAGVSEKMGPMRVNAKNKWQLFGGLPQGALVMSIKPRVQNFGLKRRSPTRFHE